MSASRPPKDQPKRIEKTLGMQLADLDDNLYLLRMAAEGVERGELAFLKVLAVLLRSTVCFSSDTEGLLWRLHDRLGFDDTVLATACYGIDTAHALAQGMHSAHWYFSPQQSYGHMHPADISLKILLKECIAFYFAGSNITHQEAILKVSQQMGGAHEAEKVQANIANLFETFMADTSKAVQMLCEDAFYVLEVGERALHAGALQGYIRLPHATYRIRHVGADVNALAKARWEFTAADELPPEGTAMVSVGAPRSGWLADGQEYDFGELKSGPLMIAVTKRGAGEFAVRLSGLDQVDYEWVAPLSPAKVGEHVAVIIRWSPSSAELFTQIGFVAHPRQPAVKSRIV